MQKPATPLHSTAYCSPIALSTSHHSPVHLQHAEAFLKLKRRPPHLLELRLYDACCHQLISKGAIAIHSAQQTESLVSTKRSVPAADCT